MMAELTASGYAPETVAKTMRWVRLTLNQAVRDRRILSSPAQGLRLPQVRRSDMRLLNPTEVQTLAEALPERYGSLAIVAAYTGLRWGELAGLRITDVDMLRRRLTVRSALIEASGQPPRLGTPKSKTSERTITLPQVVIETLARHSRAAPTGRSDDLDHRTGRVSAAGIVREDLAASRRRLGWSSLSDPRPAPHPRLLADRRR